MIPPNESLKGPPRTPRTGTQAGPGASPPNLTQRFNAATAKHQRPTPPAEPSEPMIPVVPWTDTGLPNQARGVPDDAPSTMRRARR